MGLGSFFGGGSSSAEVVEFPEATKSRKWLFKLLNQGVPDFPVMQIPGMTGAEQQGQNLLSQYINTGGMPQDYGTGMAYLRDVVNGKYNPMTGPAYQGYREASAIEEENAVNKVVGRAQQQGMADSTPAFTGEGMVRRGYSADRMSYLGNLLNQERGMQQQASGALMQGADYEAERPLRQAAAAMELGGLPRQIETAQNQAIYDALMQELLFPYNTQAQLASTIMSNKPSYFVQEGAPSDWSQIKGLIGDFGSIFGG